MRRSLNQLASVPALIVIGVFVLPGAGSFTEAELRCEEVAGTLEECCADLVVEGLACSRQTGCAGETTRPPILTVEESDCVDTLSCDALVAAGVCERIEARQVRFTQGESDPFAEGAVCP